MCRDHIVGGPWCRDRVVVMGGGGGGVLRPWVT